MAGKKFLSPLLRIVLCAAGMLILGYFIASTFRDGTFGDLTDLLRLVVFLGFAFLLVRGILDIVRHKNGLGSE